MEPALVRRDTATSLSPSESPAASESSATYLIHHTGDGFVGDVITDAVRAKIASFQLAAGEAPYMPKKSEKSGYLDLCGMRVQTVDAANKVHVWFCCLLGDCGSTPAKSMRFDITGESYFHC